MPSIVRATLCETKCLIQITKKNKTFPAEKNWGEILQKFMDCVFK